MSDRRVPTQLPALDSRVLGRTRSIFARDLEAFDPSIFEVVQGSRLLVIGGAGTIGSSTLRTLLRFRPSLVHVIDRNENGLAELVRSLRASDAFGPLPEMLFLPFDLGGDPFRLWLSSNGTSYDHVLNFSALKHVRSEKDPFSILAMLETNVLHLDRLSQLLEDQPSVQRVFSVSTDKAANPSSMMGATKRLMEHALFLPTRPWPDSAAVTSARFANVAFSNGSLLEAWKFRLAQRQPLAVPSNTRRFFIAIEESGHLCSLAALCGNDGGLLVPALEPSEHLVQLTDVVVSFLEYSGFSAHFTDDPDEALGRVGELVGRGLWPVLVTPLDTSGEKPFEEFVGVDEDVRDAGFESLVEVGYVPPADPNSFEHLLNRLRTLLDGASGQEITIDSLRELVASVEPTFLETHRASSHSLDQRI